MKKVLKSKWVIIITICIALVVFNAMVFNVSVVKRNIVVGIGLDYDGSEYTLYTQVVLPKNGGVASGGGNNYITLKGNAQNIDIAIDKIEKEEGAILSFAQAAILILGKNMMENGDLKLVDTFFMDDRVHDNLLIVMAEDKAEDIMNAQVAAGEVSSLQLVRQLRPTKAPLGVTAISLQEYVRNSKNVNKINYLPLVSVEETEPSTDQQKENLEKADKFLISKTALIDDNGLQCLLDENLTQIFSLAKMSLQDGVLKVDGDEMFSVHIIDSKAKMSYDLNKSECEIKFKLKTIRTEGRFANGKISFELSQDEKSKLIKSIDNRTRELIDYGISLNVDILNVVNGFLKKFPKKSSQILADDFLKELNFKVSVQIEQVE